MLPFCAVCIFVSCLPVWFPARLEEYILACSPRVQVDVLRGTSDSSYSPKTCPRSIGDVELYLVVTHGDRHRCTMRVRGRPSWVLRYTLVNFIIIIFRTGTGTVRVCFECRRYGVYRVSRTHTHTHTVNKVCMRKNQTEMNSSLVYFLP